MDSERVFRSGRRDGRFQTSLGFCHYLMANHVPRLAYDEALSVAAFEDWRGAVKEKLTALMGFPEVGNQPKPRQLWEEARDGYRLEKWEAFPESGSVVPFLMLIPDGVSVEHPGRAVMCFTGSAQTKELLCGEPELNADQPENKHPARNQMAMWYAKAGIIAVGLENPETGELAEGPDLSASLGRGREKLATELILLGRNYVGLSVFQKLYVLNWLRSLNFVDGDRIAVSGHSLGTEPAMVMAVLDERIRALVFNDFLCHTVTRYAAIARPEDGQWKHTIPLWHLIPGFQQWFDFSDLLAAVAPRPLLITEGGLTTHLERVGKAYETLGARKNYVFHYYPKYADRADRLHEDETVPEGLTMAEFFEYANVDAPNHCFKENLAVPWLCEVL
ncbi:MAG: alpha/beta hydrolase family protein [Candidatus Latescibacteria bacterium]|nr:alpha/beta hydrolase family protein [Candidatus Latescibacterota bacterium]